MVRGFPPPHHPVVFDPAVGFGHQEDLGEGGNRKRGGGCGIPWFPFLVSRAGYEIEIDLLLHEHADGRAPHPSRSEEALANDVSRGALERRV